MENWRKIDCPACDARKGFNCYVEDAAIQWTCKERLEAARKLYGQNIALPPAEPNPAVAHLQSRWSNKCRRGDITGCSGVRMVHGRRAKCMNPAHV